MRYLEDMEVGQRESFGSYSVTAEEVAEFARKYDPQPFHLSDEAAAKTHFGRIAASGWHSCAMMMAMLVAHFEKVQLASHGAAGVDELRWLRPVYPGDTLRCESEVVEVRPSRSRPEIGTLRTLVTVLNQEDVAVLRCITIALIGRRGEG
ncbi:MaoC family dehydratase [Stakelama pacifica]|uniref:Acyl dehydratase n=1 Tax=Stakelama pacifica TaxID=517720 RepID=A0A4R6FRY5_9SPHN|nr:MaoC family dehydratase [Stakelama pacifica]MAW99737.1 acyl dehydratase [Sphingomonas sp.]TDN84536.1 acyl dehydratase [Stakelama pacifica]GGO93520.1 acyl dehydratase [Stakelama pacifica]